MYSFDSRIRFSESDREGKLTLSGFLNYFQDCSTFQSEDLGIGPGFTGPMGIAWVVNAWQIDVMRYPEIGERISIGTIPYEIKGFMGLRNFYMKDENGAFLSKANSVWSLIDLKSGKLIPALPEMLEGYVRGQKLDMDYAPRKITVPPGGEFRETIVVGEHLIDFNHHVNNAQYIALAQSFLPEGRRVARVRAEYKKQAFLGDKLYPYVACGDTTCLVAMQDENGKTYATTEFTVAP